MEDKFFFIFHCNNSIKVVSYIFFFLMVVTGMDDPNSPFIPIKDALKDEKRIRYHSGYLSALLASIKYVLVAITCYCIIFIGLWNIP